MRRWRDSGAPAPERHTSLFPPPSPDDRPSLISSPTGPAPTRPASHFRPPRCLRGAHAQTLGARLLRPRRDLPYRRVRIETPDGDFLDLDHPPWAQEGPVVIVLHGLEGCSRSGYVVEACRQLRKRGMRPLALNFRGRSGEPNRRRRLYHSGETGDLAHVVRRIRERNGAGTEIAALGFSLGGNVLLKYLGEREAEETGLAAAAAVSVPFDLSASARHLERGASRIYAWSLLRSLKRSLRRKARRVPGAYDLERAESAGTLRAFDDAVTAPVHGFRSAAEYYRLSSSARYLSGIGVPTLVIHAEDDPFVPADSVPVSALDSNPCLEPRLCRRGGHVGFLATDGGLGLRFWAEESAASFLAGRLEAAGS